METKWTPIFMQAFVTWKLLSDKLPLISVRYGIALHVASLRGAVQNFP